MFCGFFDFFTVDFLTNYFVLVNPHLACSLQAAKAEKDKKKKSCAPIHDVQTKNEMAKHATIMIERYFAEYERKHIHLELDKDGDSLFASVVKDLLSFRDDGRSQVPMGYYRRKKRQFPGPRQAWINLQVADDARRE